jgi:hypothetical protein
MPINATDWRNPELGNTTNSTFSGGKYWAASWISDAAVNLQRLPACFSLNQLTVLYLI